jgi:hypothetical protein
MPSISAARYFDRMEASGMVRKSVREGKGGKVDVRRRCWRILEKPVLDMFD